MAISLTADDVRKAATNLGVTVAADEVEDYYTLLNEANTVFKRLIARPDYHVPVNTKRFPRKNIHLPTTTENVLGVAWSHTFSLKDIQPNNGLLAGKTFCLKDNICVAGVRQVNGSDMITPWIPEADATVVTRILEAGGEIIGTATCENMSYSPSSNTSSTGTIHNPYSPAHSAGGSSSGVGALVGSVEGYVDMGIGADQGGSIRIPAAMSGCVGLKPTHGLVPYTGIVTSEAVMDHVGPIAKGVFDVAVLLEAIAGRDGIDDRGIGAQAHGEIPYSSNLQSWFEGSLKANGGMPGVLKGMKIAVLKEAMESPSLFPKMREIIYDSAYKLQQLGAVVEEVSMPGHATGRDIWMGIRRLGGALSLTGKASGRKVYCLTPFLEKMLPLTQEMWEKTPPAVKSTLINGTVGLERYPTLYAKCCNLAIQLSREYETLLQEYDALLMPTLSRTAPPHSSRDASPYAKSLAEAGLATNTAQFNLTGHPAMTVPVALCTDMGGESEVKLPVGMQIVGPLHGEEKVLRVGYAWESGFNWKKGGKKVDW